MQNYTALQDRLHQLLQSLPPQTVFVVAHKSHENYPPMPLGVFTDARKLIELIEVLDSTPIIWGSSQAAFNRSEIIGFYNQPHAPNGRWYITCILPDDDAHLKAHASVYTKPRQQSERIRDEEAARAATQYWHQRYLDSKDEAQS